MFVKSAGRQRPEGKNVVRGGPSTTPSSRKDVISSQRSTSPSVAVPAKSRKISSRLVSEYEAWRGESLRARDLVKIRRQCSW